MAAPDAQTNPENPRVQADSDCADVGSSPGDCFCAYYADQEQLGIALMQSPDPHIRIIAHVSNRQLALGEQIRDLTGLVFRAASGVSSVQRSLADSQARLGSLETSVGKLVEVVDGLTGTVSSLNSTVGTLNDVATRLLKKLNGG